MMLSLLQTLVNVLTPPDRADEGATAVEYGLMVSLITVVIIAAVTLIGTNLIAVFNAVAAAL